MNIDPLTISCPFCSNSYPTRPKGDPDFLYCNIVTVEAWIPGGINALVGKLARKGVIVWESPEGWTWDSEDEEGKAWQTFEYCVLDAWEKMSMNKT